MICYIFKCQNGPGPDQVTTIFSSSSGSPVFTRHRPLTRTSLSPLVTSTFRVSCTPGVVLSVFFVLETSCRVDSHHPRTCPPQSHGDVHVPVFVRYRNSPPGLLLPETLARPRPFNDSLTGESMWRPRLVVSDTGVCTWCRTSLSSSSFVFVGPVPSLRGKESVVGRLWKMTVSNRSTSDSSSRIFQVR